MMEKLQELWSAEYWKENYRPLETAFSNAATLIDRSTERKKTVPVTGVQNLYCEIVGYVTGDTRQQACGREELSSMKSNEKMNQKNFVKKF